MPAERRAASGPPCGILGGASRCSGRERWGDIGAVSDARDPYEVLQVAPTAEDAVLRAAYRALAQRFHPDIAGPAGEARMRELNAAWEAIGTPEHRAAYHRERPGSEPGQAAGSTPGAGSSSRSGPSPTADTRSAPAGSAPPWTGAAGPPPGHPSGSVLDFGVYFGWSLGEIARQDIGYLQWLEPRGEARAYAAEIDAVLRRHGLRDGPNAGAADPSRRGHRIFGR